MPKYSLESLGHEEFERLCQSLLQQIIGSGTKIYGMGSDGAREATFHGKAPYPSKDEQWDGNWVFQAKFHDIQKIGPIKARKLLLEELNDELLKITGKYKIPCDNYILMTNVSLTPVFQKGIKDKIDNEILPKFNDSIKHIHILGDDEICRFLDAYPSIRQTYMHLLVTGDIISRLLGLIDEKENDLSELIKLYCQGCFNHEQYADLDDSGDVEDKRIELQEIFIDLDIYPPVFREDPKLLEKTPEWMKQIAEDSNLDFRTSTLSYLLDDSIPGLVIIGGPGSGKSTLVKYISQIYRARLIGQFDVLGENIRAYDNFMARIPFRVLLREYAQWISTRNSSDSLFHYLSTIVSEESGRDIDAENIQKIIKENPILLILDGLDEVPEKKLRTRVIDNITSFVYQVKNVLKSNLRVIATTRPYGYSQEFDPECYLHLNLQKLSPKKAGHYSDLWAKAREPNPKEANRISQTFRMCLDDDIVKVLTQTPLQVTILLIIIRARGAPPKQREELFERYMDINYQREQKKSPELLRTEQDVIYGLHKYLAYILQKRAESEETSTLMDLSEFVDKVKEYLIYSNPLLNELELENKVKQIIDEARQRLVLIESPQEGKVGFDLTTTREFFAAAHLVDTARDTKIKDLRFRAIALSPHWRNVALFFAGRVGRTRPGEASSMIDVCRQIDTHNVDKFLKRGAELVVDMVEDRVLREPHNTVGAIQFGLTLLDKKYMSEEQFNEFKNKLRSLPEEYKERVIRPWIEEKLMNIVPENLDFFVKVYLDLYGVTKPIKEILCKAPDNVKFLILTEAIRNKIIEQWVIKLLDEISGSITANDFYRVLENKFSNILYYIDYPLSKESKSLIIHALILHYRFRGLYRYSKDIDFIDELRRVANDGSNKQNALLFWAIAQLVILAKSDFPTELPGKNASWIAVQMPALANPNARSMMNENKSLVYEFCRIFNDEKDDPLIGLLVAIFQLLSDLGNTAKITTMFDKLQKLGESEENDLKALIEKIFGYHLKDKCQDYTYLPYINNYYESDEQYKDDIKELNLILNEKSKKIKQNPQRIFLWIVSDFCPKIRECLDTDILNSLYLWLKYRGFQERIIVPFSIRLENDPNIVACLIESIEEQIKKGNPQIELDGFWFANRPYSSLNSILKERLERIFEILLANHSVITDSNLNILKNIYILSIYYDIINYDHIENIYDLLHKKHNFPAANFSDAMWLPNASKKTIESNLKNMLKDKNHASVSLAAIALSNLCKTRSILTDQRCKFKLGECSKIWELAADKKDMWQPLYISLMANCQLNWSEKREELFEAIKESRDKELHKAWAQVIKNAGYKDTKNREALFDLLLDILKSEIAKPIQSEAIFRLNQLVSEQELSQFDEKDLDLPLPSRSKLISSKNQ